MSTKHECHGCLGKGWVMITIKETTMPFLDGRQPVPGLSRTTRECEAITCPVCRGTGLVSRQSATIGEAVSS